jgi:hypothetical protein
MKPIVACLVGLFALVGFATASMANHSVAHRGTVHSVDYARHTVVLTDGSRFRAAPDVDVDGLTPGTDVILYYHRLGGRNTIVSYEYAEPAIVVHRPTRRVVVPQPAPTVVVREPTYTTTSPVIVNPGPNQVVITPEPSPPPTVITTQPGPAIIRPPAGTVINPQPGQTIISSQPGATVVQPQYGEAVVVPQTGGQIRICPSGAAVC